MMMGPAGMDALKARFFQKLNPNIRGLAGSPMQGGPAGPAPMKPGPPLGMFQGIGQALGGLTGPGPSMMPGYPTPSGSPYGGPNVHFRPMPARPPMGPAGGLRPGMGPAGQLPMLKRQPISPMQSGANLAAREQGSMRPPSRY